MPLSPDRRLQMIAVDDIGGFAATAFEHHSKWLGRELDIAGADISMAELAGLLSRALGREVSYRQAPGMTSKKPRAMTMRSCFGGSKTLAITPTSARCGQSTRA